MAKFEEEFPREFMKEVTRRNMKAKSVFGEMCKVGADIAYQNIKSNMKKVFKSTDSLEKGLIRTKVYETPSDDGINVKVGFYGYDKKPKKGYSRGEAMGTPIPLKAIAREYGTSSGEKKMPFFRKAFKQAEIESAMLKKQEELFDE